MQFRYLLIIPLIIAVSGCENSAQELGVKTERVSDLHLPNYSINDVFIYDDGRIERVSNIQGEVITWETSGGAFKYKAYRNFVLPMLEWETSREIGRTEINIVDYDFLWPLEIGSDNNIGFKEYIIDKVAAFNERTFHQQWTCSVKKLEQISTEIGQFETIPITCELYFNSNDLIQSSTWFYAPKIQHYVKRVYEIPEASTTAYIYKERNLISYIPTISGLSGAESRKAELHLQTSLEKLSSGSETIWSNAKGSISRKIFVLSSFLTKDAKLCRNLKVEVTDNNDRIRQYLSVFCRDEDAWKVSLIQRS